jgi:ribonuclease P protein component
MRRIILSRAQFTAISSDKKARRTSAAHFSVVTSEACVGVAVVVSKKVAKTSVARHLLKRRIREAVASCEFPSAGKAVIVYARSGAATLSFAQITAELAPLLSTPSGTP